MTEHNNGLVYNRNGEHKSVCIACSSNFVSTFFYNKESKSCRKCAAQNSIVEQIIHNILKLDCFVLPKPGIILSWY